MSIRYSIAQRSPALNTLFAGAACAITLALTAGPAMADTTTMERVEVRGRVVEAPVRYDVHARCAGIDDQIEQALGAFAARERVRGEIQVQLVMENGRIDAVQAQGPYRAVARQVRYAAYRLDCGKQTASGPQIYRFNVAFAEPTGSGAQQAAGSARAAVVRVAGAPERPVVN